MNLSSPSPLESFHRFLGEQLQSDPSLELTPEQALAIWRERQGAIEAIQEGLANVAAGETKPVESFLADFEARHGVRQG